MTTPENIKELEENQIFVFGSNLNGNHAGGAARFAADQFGAEEGVGEGMTGQCYAFPTLDSKMKKVTKKAFKESVNKLYEIANNNLDKQFLVTKVGCGIAGFSEEEVSKLFNTKDKPKNIILPAGWATVYGYKAFEKGLVCRGFQYEFDKDFYHDGDIILCQSGFHFCKNLSDVYNYYQFGIDIVVCEVESKGKVVDEFGGEKSVTNHLRITRMLNAEEAANNSGRHNLGHSNTGDSNTGHRNTGNRNTGDSNTGHSNTGHSNTGDWNAGSRNTGNWNTGNSNTGDWNASNWNTGNCNTGDWNAGNRNTGHSNTGDWNAGSRNTGNWNTGNSNTGSFNAITPAEIIVFNKPTSRESWDNAIKPSCLYFNLTEWVCASEMSEEEKKEYPSYKTTGGYLKKYEYKEAFTKSMEKATLEEIEQIKALPNFDADIFEEISGFRIN